MLIFQIIKWALMGFPRDPVDPEIDRIMAMPLNEAMQRAAAVLSNPNRFRCTKSTTPPEQLSWFPPITREFFQLYSRVEVVDCETWISSDSIKESKIRPGFYAIGSSDMGGDEVEVSIRQGGARVYELDGFERTEAKVEAESFPSIYHWVLFNNYASFEDAT